MKLSICKSFIAKKPTVSFIEGSFYAITPSTAERKDRVGLRRIKLEFSIDYCDKAVNTTSKVCVSGTEVDVFESGSIVKHFSRPL